MEMITAIFTALGSIATNVVTWFGTTFSGITGLFWDTSGSGGGQLTLLGILSLLGLGMAVVWTLFGFIRGLITKNPAGGAR